MFCTFELNRQNPAETFRRIDGANDTMPGSRLEDVFKSSGIPDCTFVPPVEYDRLLTSLRAPAAPLVVEGTPGVGKTTALVKALNDLRFQGELKWLSAKARVDSYIIADRSAWPNPGVVIIDDFHCLARCIQQIVADQLESLACDEKPGTTLIIAGATGTGELLKDLASDPNQRVNVIKLGPNPDDRVLELIERGERALNIRLNMKPDIVAAASGSFCFAQILCCQACLSAAVTQSQHQLVEVAINPQVVIHRFVDELPNCFRRAVIKFATGPRLRREGRAVYLQVLKWLAEAKEWEVSLREAVVRHPEYRCSAGQLIEKGQLRCFLNENPDLRAVLRYDPFTTILTAEDPRLVFFLRNLDWSQVAEEIGFGDAQLQFRSRYDFALSFADSEKSFANRLFELLSESELEVFYDHNRPAPLLTGDMDGYLSAIGATKAAYVVVLLGPGYPTRIWEEFESDPFKRKFGKHVVIPVWFPAALGAELDESRQAENIIFDPQRDHEQQLQEIARLLRNKIAEGTAHAIVSA